jgi:hypothetical protein
VEFDVVVARAAAVGIELELGDFEYSVESGLTIDAMPALEWVAAMEME